MLININQIKVNDRIRKDFGDIEELANDIKENGLINPPVVTPEYELIAGERRLKACKSLGYQQIEVRAMSVKDSEHQLQIEISENENRKDFTFSERVDWAKRLERIERIKAKERQGERTDLEKDNIVQDFAQREKGKSSAIVADQSGFGNKETYRQAKYISENATENMIKELDDGKLSINKAYITLKQEKENLKNQNQKLTETNTKLLSAQVEQQELINQINDLHIQLENKTSTDRPETLEKIKCLEEREILLKEKIELIEHDAEKYRNLKNQIDTLSKKKDDIGRQIESATSLSGYIIDIEDLLKNKLAPIKYSRALLEVQNNPVVIKNISDIVECVDLWCREMRNYIPNKYNNIVTIESEEV